LPHDLSSFIDGSIRIASLKEVARSPDPEEGRIGKDSVANTCSILEDLSQNVLMISNPQRQQFNITNLTNKLDYELGCIPPLNHSSLEPEPAK
jgi:hypothetical protein